MDINRFTSSLAQRLRAAGVDGVTADRHAEAFVRSLSGEEAARLADHADNEDLMRQLTDRIKAHIPEAPSTERRETSGSGWDDDFIFEDDGDDDDDDMIDAMLSAQPHRQNPQPQQQPAPQQHRPAPQPYHPQGQQSAPQAYRPQGQQSTPQAYRPQGQQSTPQAYRPQQPASRPQNRPAQGQQPAAVRQSPRQDQPRRDMRQGKKPAPRRRRPIYKPDPNADYHKFYIILACTSPIWGFAALVVAALFALAICGLAALIVLLIVGLFVGVAVGVVLSLIGIIYGITQLFELPPVGVYEIGLGIMVGGAVMFFGILAYNGAVRLLPYVIRQVLALMSFTLHKCVELYYYVKGRCADL